MVIIERIEKGKIRITYPARPYEPGARQEVIKKSLDGLGASEPLVGIRAVVQAFLIQNPIVTAPYDRQVGLAPVRQLVKEASEKNDFPVEIASQITYVLGALSKKIIEDGLTLEYQP